MNPAQGSPPSVAAEESAPGGKKPGETEELDLSPVRRCKSKSPNLPFSVESLISERTEERSLFFPGGRQGRVLSEGTEGSSPRGLYRSNPDLLELRDHEVDHWSHAPYTSPPSEYDALPFWCHSHPGSGNLSAAHRSKKPHRFYLRLKADGFFFALLLLIIKIYSLYTLQGSPVRLRATYGNTRTTGNPELPSPPPSCSRWRGSSVRNSTSPSRREPSSPAL